MKVRYSYLSQQFSNCDDLWRDLKRFVKTGDFTLGKELSKFEKNFAKLIGTKFAVGVNSGTDAIKLSLRALNIGYGDEVITAGGICATVERVLEGDRVEVLIADGVKIELIKSSGIQSLVSGTITKK